MTAPAHPPRQPIFNVPGVVLALIVAMVAIQALRDLASDRLDEALIVHLAFVPGRLTYAIDPAAVAAPWAKLDPSDPAVQQAFANALAVLGNGTAQPWTVLSYALLHGGWLHLGLNAVWLLAFGSPVARRFGVSRFLLFMAAGAAAGAAMHFAVDPLSLAPLVGASAAVSACMGAALRFMFRSGAPSAVGAEEAGSAARAPGLPLRAVLRDRRALAFVVVWAVTNVATGMAGPAFGLSNMPIAWQAHIGGFLLGLLAFPLFERSRASPATPENAAGL